MLTELRIRNFALIDKLSVTLGPGLNVLTGETGAGKSIIVGALGLLLGERASSDIVRADEDRASVEGVFEVDPGGEMRAWLEERGIEAEEGLLILKREVALEGRNRAWINGSPVTASTLGEVGGALVAMHGQHEHQTLLRRPEQRTILDAFADTEVLVGEIGEAHDALAAVQAEIDSLEDRRRNALQRADFLRFQVDEIDAAGIDPTEEEKLVEESTRLENAEELTELANAIADGSSGTDESALDRMGALRRGLDQLVRIDPAQKEMVELFDTAYYALEELGSRAQDYLLSIEHDPDRLQQLRMRQDLLYRLKKKYGGTLEDVIRLGEEARRELALIEDAEWERNELNRRRQAAADRLGSLAGDLTKRREAAARSLEEEVNRILPDLGMDGGRFAVAMLPLPEVSPTGAEEIEFRVSLNRGFEPKPLANVASGGELSRVMLAMKTILARLDAVPTLIFDEVDAGIGGRIALKVGDKMRQVAGTHQVLAITHLPQIASRAHRHLLVRKTDDADRATTSVYLLAEEERVREVARMLGGDPESDVSLSHARELLANGAVEVAA